MYAGLIEGDTMPVSANIDVERRHHAGLGNAGSAACPGARRRRAAVLAGLGAVLAAFPIAIAPRARAR
jgi:hypothetical protein